MVFKRTLSVVVSLILSTPMTYASAAQDRAEEIQETLSLAATTGKNETLAQVYSRLDTRMDEYDKNFIFQKMIGKQSLKSPLIKVDGYKVTIGEAPKDMVLEVKDLGNDIEVIVNGEKMNEDELLLPEMRLKFFERIVMKMDQRQPLAKKKTALLWSLFMPAAKAFSLSEWTPWIVGGLAVVGAVWAYTSQKRAQKKARQRAAAAALAAQQAAEQAVKPTCCYIGNYYSMSNYGQCKSSGGYATGEATCNAYSNTVSSSSPFATKVNGTGASTTSGAASAGSK